MFCFSDACCGTVRLVWICRDVPKQNSAVPGLHVKEDAYLEFIFENGSAAGLAMALKPGRKCIQSL
ncbi:hypothetical protein PM02_00435 [Sulfitobacter mediterraneus]|uniref:Uncharacterized protein n=1 Tax=Sulfitobacter mediterraneus TaxID=83219 RepID=A0A061SVF7_9RHOB|nr:hypothetical protein PM02_00435 [Sulfitobacter mediterraneus]